jgi:adenine-specific DNA-methyltransferase
VDREDSYRHSKWLSFMKKRLLLAQELLSETGVIFISIDDNEQAQLKMLCDEIFGEENFIECFCWNKTNTPPSLSYKSRGTIEYILCYEKVRNHKKYF